MKKYNKNGNLKWYFYIAIPTINGEINGDAIFIEKFPDLYNIKEEATFYVIDLLHNRIKEIDIYDY